MSWSSKWLNLIFVFLFLFRFLVQAFVPNSISTFQRRDDKSGRAIIKSFITARAEKGKLQCAEDNVEKLNNSEELRWNVSRLLQHGSKGDSSVLESFLVEVYQAAIRARKEMKHSTTTSTCHETETPLPDYLASMARFMRSSNLDIDHAGRFRVFDNDSSSAISLPSNLLFSMDQPLSFIREKLSYQSDHSKNGGMLYDNSEAVVWCVQKDQNLEYTSRALDSMPLAQLHFGSFPSCEIELDSEIIRGLESLGVLKGGVMYKLRDAKVRCKILSQDLDLIRSLLSFHADNQNQQLDSSIHLSGQHTLVKLIDSAVDSVRKEFLGSSNEPHLVICAQSTNASLVAAALATWKQQRLRSTSPPRKKCDEDLLHKAVTVVTFGAVCQKFCDGPAYIHISMRDDCLASKFGVTEKNQHGGGRDAVFLHAWSPYEEEKKDIISLTDHDSHNMNACAIQFLYLVMRINGISSFRALYNAARYIDPRAILDINPRNFAIDYSRHKLGDLLIAPNMDHELLPAMIRATQGDKWLRNQYLDNSDFLPDSQEAKTYLEEYFGYSTYEEIVEVLSRND